MPGWMYISGEWTLQPISSNALLGVHVFNLTVVFGMFSYLALFYVSTVTRGHKRLARMATTDSLTGLLRSSAHD